MNPKEWTERFVSALYEFGANSVDVLRRHKLEVDGQIIDVDPSEGNVHILGTKRGRRLDRVISDDPRRAAQETMNRLMKLTESKLRQIIREELLSEVHPATFQRIRKRLKMKHKLEIVDWGTGDRPNLQYIEFANGQTAQVREQSHGNVEVIVGNQSEIVSKDRAADKIAEFLSMTEESKIREVVRKTIMKEAGGAPMTDPAARGGMPSEASAIQEYLAQNGTRLDFDRYEYGGLYFHIDPMGGMATFVNVFRDRNDSESVVSAKIENGKVRFKESGGAIGRPMMDEVRYTGPEQVIEALVERATGGQTAFR